MRPICIVLLTGALIAGSAQADDAEIIFAREAAFSAAIDQEDLRAVEALLVNDVRVVRGDAITLNFPGVKSGIARLFGLSVGSKFSRTSETIQISESGDFAVVTGTQRVLDREGKSASVRYVAVWRRLLEFEKEWRLFLDAPLEVWKTLDDHLSLDAVAGTPNLFVANLASSSLAQQLEPGSFRASKANDLAYSLGGYYVPPPQEEPDAAPIWGFYLATWEKNGSEWRLLHASFPEPKGTSPP